MILHFDGFDVDRTTTAISARYVALDLTGVVWGTDTKHPGFSLRASASGPVRIQTKALAAVEPKDIYTGFRYRANAPTSGNALLTWRDTADATQLTLDTEPLPSGDFFLRVRRGNDVLGITRAMARDVWFFLEVRVLFSVTTTGIVELHVNETEEFRSAGIRTTTTANDNCGAVRIGLQATSYAEIDDLYILDASGAATRPSHATWLGDSVVDTVWPDEDTVAGWVGAGAHYAYVDDAATGAMDGDATALDHDGVASAIERYRISPTNRARYEIHAAAVHVFARLIAAGSTALLGQVVSDGNFQPFPVTLNSTTYQHLRFLVPNRGGTAAFAWTREAVEAAEFGLIGDADGLAKRLTRLHVELLARAPQIVTAEAQDADQGTQAICAWNDGVRVETTWLTDVQTGKTALNKERRALGRRPVRVCSYQTRGLNRRDAVAMLTTAGRRGTNPTSGLLYSDHTRLLVAAADGTVTLWCDTRFRRFFVGQRVFVAQHGVSSRFAFGEWKTIQVVFEDRLFLTTVLVASYPVGARVYPGFGAELAMRTDGILSTSERAVFDVDLIERKGTSTLPPIWDGAEIGHFATYKNRPIFTPREQWASGMDVQIVREGERSASGKSSVIDPDGDRSRFAGTIEVQAMSRAEAWRTLQFFDRCMGRCLSFWVVHPTRAYKAVASGPNTIDVERYGELADLEELFHFFALVMADGSLFPVERAVDFIVDTGAVYRITFIEGVPVGVASVRPLLAVEFATDSVVEEWDSDEHCTISLPWEETDDTVVALEDFAAPSFPVPDPAAIPGLQVWLSAARNVYDFDPVANAFVRAQSWPHKWNVAQRWLDARYRSPDVVTQADLDAFFPYHIKQTVGGAAIDFPFRTRFQHPWLNRGHPIMIGGPFSPEWFGNPRLHVTEKEIWSNTDGLTVLVILIGGILLTTPRRGIRFTNAAAGGDILSWDFSFSAGGARFQGYAVPGVVDVNYRIDHPTFEVSRPEMFVLRWTPGGAGQFNIWAGGSLIGTSGAVFPGFPSVLGYDAETTWFTYFDIDVLSGRGVADANYRSKPMLNGFLAYRRSLLNSEINAIGVYAAKNFDVVWTPI